MPVAAPIAIGAILGGAAPALAGAFSGGIVASAVLAGALLGALSGALPLIAQQLFGKKAPSEVATATTEDVALTTYSRTGRVPLVYGTRRIGTNMIHLGKAEYREVFEATQGRNEGHLFIEAMLGLAEGPGGALLSFMADDVPLSKGSWRFYKGTADDQRAPELDGTVPEGRNFRYQHTAKVFFAGDCGFVNDIPPFTADYRGIYPSTETSDVEGVTWQPLAATLDGPTNTLVIIPQFSTVLSPRGLITYRIPFDGSRAEVQYTQPPNGIGTNTQVSVFFYYGLIDAVVMQDPDHLNIWFLGRPGLARDSAEWLPIDMGDAYLRPAVGGASDDRVCKLHTLHLATDGTWYLLVVSWITQEREQLILQGADFTSSYSFHFKPEDNAYYFHVQGGGSDRVLRYDVHSQTWTVLAYLSTTGALGNGMLKLGVHLYVFYSRTVVRINCATFEVDNVELTDFIDAEDADSMGVVECIAVGRSRHRYAGVAIVRAISDPSTLWRVVVFYEPRMEGEIYGVPATYRRYAASGGVSGRLIDKPEVPADTPFEQVVFVTNGPVSAATTAEDMIGDGADYKTSSGQTLTGLPTPVDALLTGCDVYSWVPIRDGKTRERRVVFTRETASGLEWFFTVVGGYYKGSEDFRHTNIVQTYPRGDAAGDVSARTYVDVYPAYTLLDANRALVDFYYVGSAMFQESFLGIFVPTGRVLEYRGVDGRVLIRATIDPSVVFEKMVGPDWNARHWIINEPSELESEDDPDTGVPGVPISLEGRMVGHGWLFAADLFEIMDLLGDRPDSETDLEITFHQSGASLNGRLHYQCASFTGDTYLDYGGFSELLLHPGGDEDDCKWLTWAETYPDSDVRLIVFPQNAPLVQYGVSDVRIPERFLNIISALGDQPVDLAIDWQDHNFPGETYVPGSISGCSATGNCIRRIDIYGTDADGQEYLVAAGAAVASWESTRTVIVREAKAPKVHISVSRSGWRMDLWNRRVTPAAVWADALTNTRYGFGKPVEQLLTEQFLSLHGYSLEPIQVDDEIVRRYLWNVIIPDEHSQDELAEEVLGPAQAFATRPGGKYGVAFQCAGVQTLYDFDATNMRPETFGTQVKSPKTTVNRLRLTYYDSAEHRDAPIQIDDQHDQEERGIREETLTLGVVTDLRRAHLIGRNMVEAVLSDRLSCTFSASTTLRALLEPGDPIGVTDPRGTFSRRAFRIVSLSDTGSSLEIQADAISPYVVDDRAVVGLRHGPDDGDAQQSSTDQMAQMPRTRDTSIESFSGEALVPFRVLAAPRSSGEVVFMAHRAPNSRVPSVVRVKIQSPAYAADMDNLEVSTPLSAAVPELIDAPSGVFELRGMLQPTLAMNFPANGWLVKRLTGHPTPHRLEEVLVQDLAFPTRSGDARGRVSIVRPNYDPSYAFEVDRAFPAALYSVTPYGVLEPRGYDGSPISADLWHDPGVWDDIRMELGTGTGANTLLARGDYIVIGFEGSWLPNALDIALSAVAADDQRLVIEYSVRLDERLPMGRWRPLAVHDTTRGLRQNGRIYLEIPADWAKTSAWDRHGNYVGRTDKTPRYYIRIQRRARVGSGVRFARIMGENLPVLFVEPPAVSSKPMRELAQGVPSTFRFVSRSHLRDRPPESCPGCTVVSTGGRWGLIRPSTVRLTAPWTQTVEHRGAIILPGTGYAPATGPVAISIDWDYASVSHGAGGSAFGGTIVGVQEDFHLRGMAVSVVRQSDGYMLRSLSVPFPSNTWSYTAEMRTADGLVSVVVRLQQYDDRGFLGPAFEFSLEQPGVYGRRS